MTIFNVYKYRTPQNSKKGVWLNISCLNALMNCNKAHILRVSDPLRSFFKHNHKHTLPYTPAGHRPKITISHNPFRDWWLFDPWALCPCITVAISHNAAQSLSYWWQLWYSVWLTAQMGVILRTGVLWGLKIRCDEPLVRGTREERVLCEYAHCNLAELSIRWVDASAFQHNTLSTNTFFSFSASKTFFCLVFVYWRFLPLCSLVTFYLFLSMLTL